MLTLWLFAPHARPFTWSIVPSGGGHTVKRCLDIEVNPPGAFGPLVAQGALSREAFNTIMGELERISICPAASSELVLDAGSYGVEVARHPEPVRLTWTGAAPTGWEALEALHSRTIRRLNKLLPKTAGLPYEYQTGDALDFDEGEHP